MKLTKYTHACIRLESGSRTLVIDPGKWTEPEALAAAEAVLITHEHADHVDPAMLNGLSVPIFAPSGADVPDIEGVTRISSGDEFDAAGFSVRAVGSRHAFIYENRPDCANLGFIVAREGRSVYHPGDSVFVPDTEIDIVCVPVHGPWLKLAEALDLVRNVNADVAIPMHDAGLSDRGIESVNGWFTRVAGSGYRYLARGESFEA